MTAYSLLALTLVAGGAAIGCAGILVLKAQSRSIHVLPLISATAVMLTLTLIFDNLMIAVDLYRYPAENFSGITLGLVPLEDLSYPLTVCLALPVWLQVLVPRVHKSHEKSFHDQP